MSKLLSKYEGLLLLVGVLGVLMVLALWFMPSANATGIEACGQETTYVDDNTDDHTRVNVNFNDYLGDDDREVVVTPKAGYKLVSIGIDYTGSDANEANPSVGDGQSAVTYQAPNNESIDHVTTKVAKVCRDVCNDDSASNFETVVAGQTTANNSLCEYPDPSCDDGYYLGEDKQCYPNPTPTPEPRLPDQPLTAAGAGAGAPVCTDGNTILLPAGFQVKRAGPDATYIWFQTQADQVNLYYREVGQANWTHGVANVPAKAGAFPDNYNEYTVHLLNPSLGYEFGLQQVHGCGGGQLVTAVVIDGPTTQLFPFSYWEWSK